MGLLFLTSGGHVHVRQFGLSSSMEPKEEMRMTSSVMGQSHACQCSLYILIYTQNTPELPNAKQLSKGLTFFRVSQFSNPAVHWSTDFLTDYPHSQHY